MKDAHCRGDFCPTAKTSGRVCPVYLRQGAKGGLKYVSLCCCQYHLRLIKMQTPKTKHRATN